MCARSVSSKTTEPPVVTLWAALNPVGGVTSSARHLADWLRDRDRLRAVVDLADRRALPGATIRHGRREGPHLFWCSTPGSVRRHAALAAFVSRPRWLFVHGGDVTEPAVRRPRTSFDRLFATNRALADTISTWGLGPAPELASAHIVDPSGPRERSNPVTPGIRVLLACGARMRWYRPEIGIEAARQASTDGSPVHLTLLVYGDPGVARAALDRIPGIGDDVDVRVNLSQPELDDVLSSHDVLLRPTEVDGDSLLVRDALSSGLRVIASDVVPRPIGCELAALDVDSFATALRCGGRPSTGAGLGPSIVDLI